ncbi:MAG: RAD55 family ATPase [Candidatus Lokiarchaeia archaeon]
MIVVSNVPNEIVDALESRTFSLHIKGSAGTGKTTLALELMRLFPGERTAVYLSTRVSPDRLYEQFPWSKSCIHQENILDVNTCFDSKTKEESLFEYVDKPIFFKNLYSRVLDVKGEHTIIVVDSLEALKSNLKIPMDDLSLESDILEMAEKVKANVIFVSELSGESKVDYFVDGTIRLEKEFVNDRLVRKLYIEKVRGTRIDNPMYLFTLKDGRFTVFEKGIKVNFVHAEPTKFEKVKGNKIPTRIVELDEILGGGFEGRTFNIFEVGDKVGMGHFYVMIPIFLNFVLQGYPVFSIPSKGLFSSDAVRSGTASSLEKTLISVLDDNAIKNLKKCFHVFLPSSKNLHKAETYNTHSLKGEDYTEDLNYFTNLAVEVLDEVQADTLFVTMASDTMEYVYGANGLLKIIQNWMDRIKGINGFMAMFQFGHETFRLPTHLATSYFKLENIGGNILFYGEIPKTKMYVASLDVAKNYFQTRFTPIE